jgi:hypothetical protein
MDHRRRRIKALCDPQGSSIALDDRKTKAFLLKPRGGMFILESMADKAKQSRQSRTSSRQIDAIQAALDYGIDVSMLVQNIRKSYSERIIRHQIALDTVEKLRKAKRR